MQIYRSGQTQLQYAFGGLCFQFENHGLGFATGVDDQAANAGGSDLCIGHPQIHIHAFTVCQVNIRGHIETGHGKFPITQGLAAQLALNTWCLSRTRQLAVSEQSSGDAWIKICQVRAGDAPLQVELLSTGTTLKRKLRWAGLQRQFFDTQTLLDILKPSVQVDGALP